MSPRDSEWSEIIPQVMVDPFKDWSHGYSCCCEAQGDSIPPFILAGDGSLWNIFSVCVHNDPPKTHPIDSGLSLLSRQRREPMGCKRQNKMTDLSALPRHEILYHRMVEMSRDWENTEAPKSPETGDSDGGQGAESGDV